AGQNRVGLDVAVRGIPDEDRDRLRGVPGGLEHLEPDAAELEDLAVAHRLERVVGLRAGAEMDRRAGALAELEVARDEVRVEVGEEHMADLEPEPIGVLEVLLDVALRVDDRGLAGALVADEV